MSHLQYGTLTLLITLLLPPLPPLPPLPSSSSSSSPPSPKSLETTLCATKPSNPNPSTSSSSSSCSCSELPPMMSRSRTSFTEPTTTKGVVVGAGRRATAAKRARHCALAAAASSSCRVDADVGVDSEGRDSYVEKIQHSVSGARVRSAQIAANWVGCGSGDDDDDEEEGGKVAMMRAEGEEVWNWRRRRRGREVGRWWRRWGARVVRGVGWV